MKNEAFVTIAIILIFMVLLCLHIKGIEDPIDNFLKAYDIHLPDSIINIK